MDYASKNWVISLINKVKALLTANGTGIVESGSNSYGEYEIFKNGRIHMTGWGFVTWTSGAYAKDITVTLPYESIATKMRPQVTTVGQNASSNPTAINDTTSLTGVWATCRVLSSTQIQVRIEYYTGVADTARRLFSWEIWGTV